MGNARWCCMLACLLVAWQQTADSAVVKGGFNLAGGAGSRGRGGLTTAVAMPTAMDPTGQLQIFFSCRQECLDYCSRLVYTFDSKKEFCHKCLRNCFSLVQEQMDKQGIRPAIRRPEQMLGDAPESKRQRRRRHRKNKRNRRKRNRRNRRNNGRKDRGGADPTAGRSARRGRNARDCAVR